jgi:phosphoglucosamine mutase
MKRVYFGTDGVRGPYGGPIINEAFATPARTCRRALGRWRRRGVYWSGYPRVRRIPGRGRGARTQGMRPSGRIAWSRATPAVARRVRDHDGVLGVMITASHNPAGDNGIKFFARKGIKLSDEDEALIEEHLPPEGRTVGANGPLPISDGTADYITGCGSNAARGIPGGLEDRAGYGEWINCVDESRGAPFTGRRGCRNRRFARRVKHQFRRRERTSGCTDAGR